MLFEKFFFSKSPTHSKHINKTFSFKYLNIHQYYLWVNNKYTYLLFPIFIISWNNCTQPKIKPQV